MSNRPAAVLIGLCALVFASGCASTRQFVPLPDQARAIENPEQCRIYVFRPEAMMGAVAKMKVMDGTRIIGDLGMASFLCWERAPGKVEVFMDFYSSDGFTINMREELDAQARGVYYLRAGLLNPFSGGSDKLDRLWRISEEDGKRFLQTCKPPPLAPPQVSGNRHE